MKKLLCFAAAIAAFGANAAQAADTVTYNSAPADTWHYGTGNDYTPANSAVLTTDFGDQLALRFHQTFVPAPASVGNVYNFALGTTPLSFDWSIDVADEPFWPGVTGLLTLTNVGTGATYSYDPLFVINDNSFETGSAQNSFRFNWVNDGLFPFIAPHPGFFDPNVDSTYRVNLDVFGLVGGARSLSVDAQFGAGANGAVPEPATWAMMILGFGLVGGAMRRKAKVGLSYA